MSMLFYTKEAHEAFVAFLFFVYWQKVNKAVWGDSN